MEDSAIDQSSAPAIAGRSSSKLRYPLRSAAKPKDEKPPPPAELSNSSVPRRGRSASNVSQSVSVLDLSSKEKSGKPPRRLSIPAKSTVSPVPKTVGDITPILEASARSSVRICGKNGTPVSDVPKSSNRKKFSILLSASYWLSQIKLSECAAKHTISLGFFKLALEAGCESIQRMRDELKSYAQRHNLAELGEPVKELFESYGISEKSEQLQVSEICSQAPEEGTRSSDDDVHSSSSGTRTGKLKPKSSSTTNNATQVSPAKESAKNTRIDKPGTRTRGSWNRNSADAKSGLITAGRNASKKSQKPTKQESNDKIKRQGEQAASEQDSANPCQANEALQENKENMNAPQVEEISLTEV
ncbi:uncharacterized protein LOC131310874 isoform X1 [Rhododendron vialii]|uniref:uncharacterized protein LOC131310874 isoform X1 n=1 Tax=Rhododendron vialii TaxID=182163 RepID=UPI00265DE521|nr:uncharacterized protein LOC131310874 isoform X1 [Rhododendron vialii]